MFIYFNLYRMAGSATFVMGAPFKDCKTAERVGVKDGNYIKTVAVEVPE